MMKRKWSVIVTVVAMAALLVAAGCSSQSGGSKVKLAYVAWDSEIASTNVVKTVLEKKLGYQVEMLQVDAGPMFIGVADGSADAMVAGWLPVTHKSYMDQNKDKFVDLGTNLDGAKTGLVVPAYMEDVKTIEDLKKPEVAQQLGNQIIGIEPGAGIMTSTNEAIKAYGLDGYKLVESSSAAMATELDKAYKAKKPIVITGWTPHWMFAKMELKYLEDPKKAYGEAEQIHTIARKGLDQDQPKAYKFLDQFQWGPDDMAEVMVDIQSGTSPEDAAAKWVDAHPDQVNEWLKGIE